MIPRAISTEALRDIALSNGVCIRPVVHEVLDTETGRLRMVTTPCGGTLEAKCPPCARRNRVLRMTQCREGWHLEQEPAGRADREPTAPRQDDGARRVRSTRHRQDTPQLPRLPVDKRTVGDTFTAPSGVTYRPSMFVTLTLPSYGRVRPDGTPVDPGTYDYRRAALDAMHFPKLLDRFWQNLRRATGYQVQYFAAVEAQRRLSPHLHAAIRGAIPRELLRQVAAATYHQVWWPPCSTVLYDDSAALAWVEGFGYVDASSGRPLLSWDQAMDELDVDLAARPSHTIRFGRQMDVQGIIASEGDADRRVAYLTKYLSKSFGAALGQDDDLRPRQVRHLERLHREVRWLPCSPRCANWLRFGVQPMGAAPGMQPGQCPAKAHTRTHLGCGGRRVLTSRKWSGKTLTEHRADRAEVVRETLLAAGMGAADLERLGTGVLRKDGRPRFEWKLWNAAEATIPAYRHILGKSIAERLRWTQEYQSAKSRAGPEFTPSPTSRQPAAARGGQVGQG